MALKINRNEVKLNEVGDGAGGENGTLCYEKKDQGFVKLDRDST